MLWDIPIWEEAQTVAIFERKGAHVLVDGQFGSTGKGALAAWLAHQPSEYAWAGVISNAGPNSGHTFYHEGEKHVLKQLPTFAVAKYLLGETIPVYLSAGAIINPDVLAVEAQKYPGIPITIDPRAALLSHDDQAAEHSGTIAAVAGTRSGTGSVLARKIQRDPRAVCQSMPDGWIAKNVICAERIHWADMMPYFVEVSQGFSLGINSEFYPKVTSRECTVMQAITDCRIPPRHVTKTYMSLRTYPIRVGNVDGFDSGGWYHDQREVTWEEIGVEPERTTVTNRIRRVATFSPKQVIEALQANDPDYVFLNFLNYCSPADQNTLIRFLQELSASVHRPFKILRGYGPNIGDITENE